MYTNCLLNPNLFIYCELNMLKLIFKRGKVRALVLETGFLMHFSYNYMVKIKNSIAVLQNVRNWKKQLNFLNTSSRFFFIFYWVKNFPCIYLYMKSN